MNSIKFIVEKMIRISTILVYGRLKFFIPSANFFIVDKEFDHMCKSIKNLVEIVYTKLQVDEETMEDEEIDKKIRIPRFLYDSSEIRKKLNMLSF